MNCAISRIKTSITSSIGNVEFLLPNTNFSYFIQVVSDLKIPDRMCGLGRENECKGWAERRERIGVGWAEGSEERRRVERKMFALQAVGQVYGTCWSASSSDVTSCAGGHPVSLPDCCPRAITKSMLVKKQKKKEKEREEKTENSRENKRMHPPVATFVLR